MSDDGWKDALGWTEALTKAFVPHAAKGLAPARVVASSRKYLKVLCARGEIWARTGGRMMRDLKSGGDLPVVGDWVAARIPEAGEALVHAVLPRRTAFTRKEPGTGMSPQVLAANIDTVFLVMALSTDFSLRRLERYLALAWHSGAQPVVVLNKRDLLEPAELAEALGWVREQSGDAPVYAISALSDDGLDEVKSHVRYGQTVALLGSSGVGKSTLVNRLLGIDTIRTQTTRDDGKGRHTTTERTLLPLPSGGALIDTPGLREVALWEGDLDKTFDDIEALAQNCRFADCAHDAEPGCAVKAALENETLEYARFESWGELKRELERLSTPDELRGRPETKRRARLGHGTTTSRPKK